MTRCFRLVTGTLIAFLIVVLSWPFFKQTRPPEPVPVPYTGTKPKLALVLDDFGYTDRNFEALGKIDAPLTLAVLPNLPYSQEACSRAVLNNMEWILHLPMEPIQENAPMEKDTIMMSMDEATIKDILRRSLTSVSGARGVSNHMGSAATGAPRVMEVVFTELKARNMFFLDSMTTPDSVCSSIAADMDVPYEKRDIFIDNIPEEDAIIKQIGKAMKIARAKGKAIAIGHDKKITVEVLRRATPYIQKSGIQFVTLLELVQEEACSRHHPAKEN
ncbi:MAG: divergent polysaccharide deacetylase family protein [Candidatus Omnitrophica bacterium]|nr:divergent polysaccharide deacetylase family protein [Candidatus Omnitrophota bacterium]MBU1127524.1 divergent polysaccharide deacetylase family protein [Candidatus Omnitrophota bacterium]MBU1657216.1 divergent polysaccharide deacetylase family protein [Candidatus Omnitrophota bacterium]MBU1783816.1 divergent polysaccharide deacetylase family protein [Candidatus Omnitrophota bacterium]MBU1851407.1 divergent polysaccharide deacetylase family protein [Candidatus Omnitrophota bacterium]